MWARSGGFGLGLAGIVGNVEKKGIGPGGLDLELEKGHLKMFQGPKTFNIKSLNWQFDLKRNYVDFDSTFVLDTSKIESKLGN